MIKAGQYLTEGCVRALYPLLKIQSVGTTKDSPANVEILFKFLFCQLKVIKHVSTFRSSSVDAILLCTDGMRSQMYSIFTMYIQ